MTLKRFRKIFVPTLRVGFNVAFESMPVSLASRELGCYQLHDFKGGSSGVLLMNFAPCLFL